ncbi:hypothetical protein HHK36_005443 [Tetracentron sinense]|uniref:Major facilitator superfamily (MFS) profile domain-containing protein n=1 Tax=Tetracentron sinense TaxID=13715 RepID=A0A835DMA9_TETSI|nr:hypothetical protein HHK36_005443 [Tetracentron sinense]
MADAGMVTSGNGREYPGNLTPIVLATCIVAAMGGLIFGYDIGTFDGVTSSVPFLKKFFPSIYREIQVDKSTNLYCTFYSQTLIMFTSSLYLAALLASFMASWVTRKFGRKKSMLIGGLLCLAGAAVNGAAKNVAMLIVGRILLGFGIGFENQSVPLYLSEMAPYRYRGALNNIFQLWITIGIVAPNILNYCTAPKNKGGWGWRVSLGGAAVPALIITIGSLLLPDSPNSMIEASRGVEHPWRTLLMRKYRPHLTMTILIPLFQQLTGINVFFKTIGLGSDASLELAVIIGLVNVAATCVSIYGSDKWGRRALFIVGGIQMLVSQIAISILIALKFGVDGEARRMSEWYDFVAFIFICIYVTGFAWSWGPLGWLVPSEILPLEIRSAAQSIAVSVNMLFTFTIAQVLHIMDCHLKFGLFIFFAFFVLVMTTFIYFFLPETKNVAIKEMSRVWKQHWYWSKFVADEDVVGSLEMAQLVLESVD